MDADEFVRRQGHKFGSPWEERFVREVLSRVPELDWEAVQAQKSFPMQGRTGYMDFAIVEGNDVRISIEVHGYDKDGSGHLTHTKFVERLNRAMIVQQAGWHLINVPNRLVAQYPEQCARTVQLVLRRERAMAAQLGREGPSPSPEVLRRRGLSKTDTAELEGLLGTMRQEIDRLQHALAEQSHLARTVEGQRDSVTQDRQGMLRLARYFTVVLVALATVATVAVFGGRNLNQGAGEEDSAQAAICDGAVDWREVAIRIGEVARVRGRVVDTTYRDNTKGSPAFLNIGSPYPDADRFVVVIWGRHRDAFPQAPEVLYLNEEIAVQGRIDEFQGVPQIELDSPEMIVTC